MAPDPSPDTRRPLATAALLVASLVVTFAVAEQAARWVMRRPPGALFVAASVEPDPVRGWRHRPGATGNYGHGSWAINRRGLRDVDRDLDPAPGVRRVLILGDSFAEGFSVPFEACVSQALEAALKKGCAAEVVNGGTVGYSTDQEYLFYRDEGSRYGARVVVLLLYHNDILYNARGAVPGGVEKPLFTFAGGVSRVKNLPLAPPRTAGPARPPWWRGSAALTWVRGRLAEGAPGTYDFLARLRFWSPLDREPPLELRVFERDPPEPLVQAWLQTGHLLRLLDAEVRSHDARLLVAYVPSKMEVDRREWDRVVRRYGIDEREWDRGRVARLLEDVGARAGFPVLDLTDALWAEEASTKREVYHRGGGHWNEAGHAVAAREIRGRLGKTGWLACGDGAAR